MVLHSVLRDTNYLITIFKIFISFRSYLKSGEFVGFWGVRIGAEKSQNTLASQRHLLAPMLYIE